MVRLLWYYQRKCKKVKHRDQAHPWDGDGDADADKYCCFVRILEALELDRFDNMVDDDMIDEDTASDEDFGGMLWTGGDVEDHIIAGTAEDPDMFPGSYVPSLSGDNFGPIKTDLWDGRSLLKAGEVLDAEMLANSCTAPLPNYTPRLACDFILSKWNLLLKCDISPLQFIADECGKHGVQQ